MQPLPRLKGSDNYSRKAVRCYVIFWSNMIFRELLLYITKTEANRETILLKVRTDEHSVRITLRIMCDIIINIKIYL